MYITKKEANIENKIKKSNRPITITTNINPGNYVSVNKTNLLASLYLKMSQKIQLKKNKNIQSSSNILNYDDSPRNDFSNNSLRLPNNYSKIKNLKTNNISGYNTNRYTNYEQKLYNKKDYLIHVNLNRNHTSSLSNYILNTKNNYGKNGKIKYENNKSFNTLNNSNYNNNSINCMSTRQRFLPKKETKLDLKKIKNKKRTKKFKLLYNERKNNNKYLSTTFSNININNKIERTLQKSENNNKSKISTKNRINPYIKNEKHSFHWRYNTMIINENDINDILKKSNNNNSIKQKTISDNSQRLVKQNNKSFYSLKKTENKKKLDNSKNKKNNDYFNGHIRNSLSSNGNKICINYNILKTKEKNTIPKQNKKINRNKNINKNKKEINTLFKRKVKIDKKELFQEIKNKIDKKDITIKNHQKKVTKIKAKEKIKEFSKIIVLDDDKFKKTAINFYNNQINNKENIINDNEYSNRTKRESIINKNNNEIFNNFKNKEGMLIEKNRSFKSINVNNKSIINDILEYKSDDVYTKDNNLNDQKTSFFPYNYNVISIPYIKKNNQKKPIIKIITNNKNFSFMKNNIDLEFPNISIANNSGIMSFRQNDSLLKDENLIIRKKKNIGNNSFYINKKLINYYSKFPNNNIEIKNELFVEENLLNLSEDYDEKYDDLYSVVKRINFGSVLIGAESIFSWKTRKHKEFQIIFDSLFNNKYNRTNLEDNKGKILKKINNSCSIKTDFSSSNKNFNKNIQNNSIIPNEFQISELI